MNIKQDEWDLWTLGIAVVAVALSVIVPLRLVAGPTPQSLPLSWEIVATLLFAADVVVRWFGKGRVHGERRKLGLAADVLAALPLGLLHPVAGLLRLLKLIRVGSFFGSLRHNPLVHPSVLRIGVFGFVIGSAAMLFTRMDMAKAQRNATLERLSGFLRYTATVRAIEYCDLYCLDRATFLHTLEGYPRFTAHSESVSKAHSGEAWSQSSEEAPLQ